MPRRYRSNRYLFSFLGFIMIGVLLFCFWSKISFVKVFMTTKYSVAKPLLARPVTVTGEPNISYFMNRIWPFTEDGSENIFVYKKVLQEKHAFDENNINLFREEIRAHLGSSYSKDFIVDQQNSPLGTKLHFNLKTSREKVFTVTKDFFRRIPKKSELGNLGRCSVIGNSGTILGSRCGKEIDEADFIFRCNAAPIKPFGADAGKKSNLTSFNPSIFTVRYGSLRKHEDFTHFLKDMREYNGFVWGSCFSTSGYIRECLTTLYNYTITENSFVMGHPDHFQNHFIFWEKRGISKRPTTGFYFTSMAIYHCDEVHLYGFWPFSHIIDKSIKRLSYHYFDNIKFDFDIENRHVHVMDMEFAILVQLHLLGIIKIHFGNCASGV